MTGLAGNIGRKTIESADYFLQVFAFTWRMFALLFHRDKSGRSLIRRTTAEQVYFTAIQALPLVILVALVAGSAVIVKAAAFSGQIEDPSMLSDLAVILIIRETGPFFVAIIVILRSALAVTIETGYMTILKEIDAIEMMGIDPARLICLPRLLGITISMLCLFIVFDTAAILGGYAVAWTATSIPLDNFLGGIGKSVTTTDIVVPIIKGLLFGVTITANCLYRGLNVKHAITEIPPACSKAGVQSFLFCFLINGCISVLFYL